MTDHDTNSTVSNHLKHGYDVAKALQQATFETRTSNSSLRPTTVDTHPPGVPDEIATQTPITAGRYHIVLPQGKDWENTRLHAVWHAYDGSIEAFQHPSAPDDSNWWLILQKQFDGQSWAYRNSCVVQTASRTGEILALFLNGDRNAIRTARRDLPDHVTSDTTTGTASSADTETQSVQYTLTHSE